MTDVFDKYFFDHAPCGFVVTREDGTIVSINQTLLQWLGRTEGESSKAGHFAALLALSGRIFYETHMAPLLQLQGFVDELALDLLHSGGHRIPALVNASLNGPVGEDGQRLCRITVFNATERRRYEREILAMHQKVAESEKSLARALQQVELALAGADLGLWDINLELETILFNPRQAHMLGYSFEELLEAPHLLASSIHGDDRGHRDAALTAHLKGETDQYEDEHRARTKDGSWIWVLARGKVVERAADGRAIRFVGTDLDITSRKSAEQMKAEFVSVVSHELRTPLTSISGALGLVVGGALGAVPEPLRQMIEMAHKNSLRLNYLINDLLDMEKLAAGKMRLELVVQDLMPLVEASIESVLSYGEKNHVKFSLVERPNHARVCVDGSRFQQVLANFLSNAAKFSPTDGLVEIAVRNNEGIVRVNVIDHGPGIPEEFRARIFQKFSQADGKDTRQTGGTGLGLAISKEFIEQMKGRVGFDSEPGKGSCFYLELAEVLGD